jgi:hypothetical protein
MVLGVSLCLIQSSEILTLSSIENRGFNEAKITYSKEYDSLELTYLSDINYKTESK